MNQEESNRELPKEIDYYLGILSKLYLRNNEETKLKIIVNAHTSIEVDTDYDNWNGGSDGHTLFLSVSDSMYMEFIDEKDALQREIATDLNKLHNLTNEYIAGVVISIQRSEQRDWRAESGFLTDARPIVPESTLSRIWGDGFRVFLSHKTEVKKETAELKSKLAQMGISAFVAHEDIHPTQQWQIEIESALSSMHAFVALLTTDFHDSLWTDQEVGFAVARGVPIIAVRMGKDPYGFIGKFQALNCSWENGAVEITKLLIKQPAMLDAFTGKIEKCSSYDHGNFLSLMFPHIEALNPSQEAKIVNAYHDNSELRGSYGFNGKSPTYYGTGLAGFLKRTTQKNYAVTRDNISIYSPRNTKPDIPF
jgi:hypothetical protein